MIVGGSMAVFLAAVMTISYGTLHYRALTALIVTLVEGFTLQYDNLFITTTILVAYCLS